MNYQKELDKLIAGLEKSGIFRNYYCIAAVPLAAVTCWNISPIILRSPCFITILIFP